MVSERWTAKPRMKLPGDRPAAERIALLEDERRVPGLREIESGRESVVAGADDDGVHSELGVGVGQNLQGGVSSRCPHDSPAGMCGGAAHVQVSNRSSVLSPSRRRTKKEQLLQRQFALEDVALRQSPLAFEVERRDDLAMTNDVGEIRRVLGDGVHDGIAKFIAFFVP